MGESVIFDFRFSLVIALFVCLSSQTALGRPYRTVIQVTSDVDRALFSRIQGQTSDLEVELIRVVIPELDFSLEKQIEKADKLSRAYEAQSVIWFEITYASEWNLPEEITIYISEEKSQKLFVRTVRTNREGPQDSARPHKNNRPLSSISNASLEAAALVVRTALRGPSMVSRKAQSTAQGRGPSEGTTSTSKIPLPKGANLDWTLTGGWQIVWDRASSVGHQGAALSVHALWQRFDFAFTMTAAPAQTIDDSRAKIQLGRYTASLSGAIRYGWRESIFATMGLHTGVAFFHRITKTPSTAVLPTSAHISPSFLLSPEIIAGWTPLTLLAGRLGLLLQLACDVVPGAPTFGFANLMGEQLSPAHKTWKIQPRLGLAIQFVFR
jgi:hypothetical protein